MKKYTQCEIYIRVREIHTVENANIIKNNIENLENYKRKADFIQL